MEKRRSETSVVLFPVRRIRPATDLGDLRFRTLLGESAWAALPEAVRARFGRRIAQCQAVVFAGEVVECRISAAGWLLAQAARLIGAPLPLSRDADVPALVSVTEDVAAGGQLWTRIYGRQRGFPQVISSRKCFSGSTGLEEHVGCGFSIALRAQVAECQLQFVSEYYMLTLGSLRLRIPRWLAPGRLTVSHVDCNHGLFAFVLSLRHRVFGEMIHQVVMFRERPEG